jgi:3-deoxy-D-arabino-heptulosonate 7-phosphate (DAHP) synthase
MIIAGPCLYTDKEDHDDIIKTAESLMSVADVFRCKIFGGGTSVDKYFPGIGIEGLKDLEFIQEMLLPVCTEVHDLSHLKLCNNLHGIWIGARNSQNYTLLAGLSGYDGLILLKRGTGMTINELMALYDIMKVRHGVDCYIVERGVVTIDRQTDSRWSPDLKGIIQIKFDRPDIFERIIIDCSHSVGRKEYINDIYRAFKAIGIKNYMFECTYSGKSKTDSGHMLSVEELKSILNAD